MGRMNDRGAVVLCGGASRRMGQAKALLPFGDRTFLETVVDTVSSVAGHVVVVAAPDQVLPKLPGHVRVAHDTVAHQGPLAGMLSGFEALADIAGYAFVTGTDTPLLSASFVRAMFDEAAGHDMAIPFDGDRHHPLAAAYHVRNSAEAARRLLAEGRRRPIFLMERARVAEVPWSRVEAADPAALSFRNVNTPADFRALSRWAGLPVPDPFRAAEVSVEFFGVARLKAGAEHATIAGDTVGEALAVLAERFPGLAGSVIVAGRLHAAFMLMRGTAERLIDPESPLSPGDTLLLLNMDAGG